MNHYSKITVTVFFMVFSITLAVAQQPVYQWVKSFGGTKNDSGIDIIADDNGNAYVLGVVTGTADLDPGIGTFMVTTDTIKGKLFLSKFDATGNFIWAGLWDKGLYNYEYSLDFFPNGDVALTGYYDDQVDMDPGSGVFMLNAGAGLKYFVLRLSPAGNFVWVKEFGGMFNTPRCYSEIDSAGNCYIAGHFSNTRDFDPGPGTFSMTAVSRDIFIMKLDSSGNFLWAKMASGTQNNWVYDVALSPLNEIVLIGSFSGTTDFDPGPGSYSIIAGTTSTAEDFYIAKYSESGMFMWLDHFDANNVSNQPEGVEIASNGMIYVTGQCSINIDLNPDSVSTYLTSTSRYLLKINPDGSFNDAKELGSKMFVRNLEIDAWNHIYLMGSFIDTIDADPGAGVYQLVTDSSGFGSFMLALDSGSNLIWADGLGGYYHGGVTQNILASIYADAQGTVYFTGRFEDHQLNFGPYQLQNATPFTYYYIDGYFGKIESITSGLNAQDYSEKYLAIYPNPTTDHLNLKSKKHMHHMLITDISGKTIASTIVNDYTLQQYDISALQSGLYFMQVFYDDGTRSFGKFVKN